ncbi:hypothetical protein C1885_07580 [Pseudomonas sp. GW531-R1]|nr:hypothetical protein C1885_07580 [Pseudomonas sp. GW531-R1]
MTDFSSKKISFKFIILFPPALSKIEGNCCLNVLEFRYKSTFMQVDIRNILSDDAMNNYYLMRFKHANAVRSERNLIDQSHFF